MTGRPDAPDAPGEALAAARLAPTNRRLPGIAISRMNLIATLPRSAGHRLERPAPHRAGPRAEEYTSRASAETCTSHSPAIMEMKPGKAGYVSPDTLQFILSGAERLLAP